MSFKTILMPNMIFAKFLSQKAGPFEQFLF